MNGNDSFSSSLFSHAKVLSPSSCFSATTYRQAYKRVEQFNLLIHQEQQYYHSLNHKTKNITIEDSTTPPDWKTVKRPYGHLDQVFSNC